MAKRHYFGHTNPDGHGANYLVRQAGYTLPSFYPSDGNNIESIAAGQTSPSAAWSSWMGSSGHKQHLLGELDFYAAQTSYGVGYYYDPGSQYVHYWVVITAPPNATPPPPPTPAPPTSVISVVSPAVNAVLTTPAVSISGTTSGTKPASAVRFRVENSAGVGEFRPAAGTLNWSGAADLLPGVNTIRVQSLDAAGAVLKEATRAVRYVVLAELSVTTSGEGAVTAGFSGTTMREIGRSYSITAIPAAGFVFNGWTGSATTASAVLPFTMSEGFAVTANFIPNPFLAHTGSFNGLVAGGGQAGFVKLALTGTGRFSGALVLGISRFTFAGQFDNVGDAVVTIRRVNLASLTMTLHADLVGDTQHVSGAVTDGIFTATISADRARLVSEGPSPNAGRYTVTLPGNVESSDPAQPRGHGFALLTVNTAGVAAMSGVLADGRPFSSAATISKDGELPIFVPLYATGFLAGTLHCRDSGVSDLDGVVHWSKPLRALDRYQKPAFELETPVIGSRYVPPAAAARVILAADGADNVRLAFGHGDLNALDQNVNQSATLDPANRVLIPAPQIAGLRVTITAANGRYTGSFTHPVSGVVKRFDGVIFQKQNAGYGYFLGVEQSGFSAFGVAP